MARGVDTQLIVNSDKVIKKGLLIKKGGLFNRYKDQYMFYLEEPSLLKYGKRDKPLVGCIDLSEAQLAISRDSTTKFKVTGRSLKTKVTLKLKAADFNERKDWLD